MSDITIRRGDEQYGPYHPDVARQYVTEGRLLNSDLAWREGDAEWRPLGALLGTTVSGPPLPHYDDSVQRYAKSPFGRRALATIIDGLIAGVVPFAVAGLFGGFAGLTWGHGWEPNAGIVSVIGMGIAWAWAIWYGFAKDGFEGGAGYGKRAVGLMVVHLPNNRPCTKGQSSVRQIVSWALGLFFGLGTLLELILVLAKDDGRRLADEAASTQVILASDYRGAPR